MVQVCYGFFMAAEIAYYTYMYAKVDRERYQQVTGHARASLQIGRFVASVLSQILVSYNLMDLRELNYISLGGEHLISLQRDLMTFSDFSSSRVAEHRTLPTVSWHQHLHVEL